MTMINILEAKGTAAFFWNERWRVTHKWLTSVDVMFHVQFETHKFEWLVLDRFNDIFAEAPWWYMTKQWMAEAGDYELNSLIINI